MQQPVKTRRFTAIPKYAANDYSDTTRKKGRIDSGELNSEKNLWGLIANHSSTLNCPERRAVDILQRDCQRRMIVHNTL